MNKYELMVILKESLKEAEAKAEVDAIKAKITELKGKPVKEDFWGLKSFAFEMKKQLRGYYAVLEYELEIKKTAEFTTFLTHEEATILRFLVTKKD